MNSDRFAVVLVRPQESGNIGAVARAMANMGRSRLILVDPQAAIDSTARAFAVHAGHILENASIAASLEEAVAPFQRVAGTTAGRGRLAAGRLVTAAQLPEVLQREDSPATPTALVFGGEASGLRMGELALCDPLVSIPTSIEQPTLNLAQAALIVLYELAQSGQAEVQAPQPEDDEPRANHAEIQGLFGDGVEVLKASGFARDDTFDAAALDLRRLLGRAAITQREVNLLRGALRRLRHRLERTES